MVRMFSTYVVVQLLAYVIDMGGFLLLTAAFGFAPVLANICGKVAAGGFAFLMHRRFTFGVHRHANARAQLFRYALLLAANIPVSSLLLAWLLHWFAWGVVAKVVSDLICVVLTFVASRTLVFTPPKRTPVP
jgi:putative flippase GtrA